MSDLAVIAVCCGLGAAIAWGIGDFFGAKATRIGGPVSAAICVNILGAVAFGIFYLTTEGFHLELSASAWGYTLAAGAAMAMAQVGLFKAFNIGPVSLVSPLSSTYPLITTLGLVVCYGTHLSNRQVIGIAAVMAGILVASEILSIKKDERKLNSGVVLALLTALAWGIGYTFLAQAMGQAPWQVVTMVQLLVIAIVCTIAVPFVKGKETVTLHSTLRLMTVPYAIAAGLVITAGVVVINIGLSQSANLAPVVTAISATYPILTIFLVLRHFKEDFRLIPLGGAVLGIIGVITLSLG